MKKEQSGRQDEPPSVADRIISVFRIRTGLHNYPLLPIFNGTKGCIGIPIWGLGNSVKSVRNSRGRGEQTD